jgi:SAM-dependent methyltransferase
MELTARVAATSWLSRLSALLERPRFYALAGRLLAPGAGTALRSRIATELLTSPSGRRLDVGCGPRSWLAGAGAAPVGVDASPAYARALRRAGGAAVVARAEALPFRDGSFASAWCFGLLHHLSDEVARRALAEAARVARAGRIVVFDAVLPRRPRRQPLAWALRRLDRGGFMRGEVALRALLSGPGGEHQACGTAEGREGERNRPADWRVTRFTYSWTGLEGLWCTRD